MTARGRKWLAAGAILLPPLLAIILMALSSWPWPVAGAGTTPPPLQIEKVKMAARQKLDHGDFGRFRPTLDPGRPGGYELVKITASPLPFRLAERFEVRDGDCHPRDCARDRERLEMSEQASRNQPCSQAFYQWWFYLPDDWPDIWPAKTVLGQFHQEKSHPLWMFLNYHGGLWLDDHSRGKSRRKTELIPAGQLRGRWHHLEVTARWARNESGFFRVKVDGVVKFSMNGPTMTAQKVYFKYGVYRSFLSRYRQARRQNMVPAQTAYFANVRKTSLGTDRECLMAEASTSHH